MLYTVFYSSGIYLNTSAYSKIDLFKFLDKYGNEFRPQGYKNLFHAQLNYCWHFHIY